jgi:hypothetical protein
MPLIWGGNRSAWDFQNPKNWVINKSLSQNLSEFSTGMQIIGTVVPEALAYKSLARFGATMASTEAATAATSTAGATAGAGSVGAGTGLLGAGIGVSALGLAKVGLEVGAGFVLLDWLKENWWIPALFLGGYIALKYVDKK